MNENESSVKIRLELDVPVGTNIRHPGYEGGRTGVLFVDPIKPGTNDPLPDGAILCVTPDTSSALGSIDIGFTYSGSPLAVKAIVYPTVTDPGSTFTPPAAASSGSYDGAVWRWTGLKAADHKSVGPFPSNIVRLWYQLPFFGWYPDSKTYTFYGCTKGYGSCGSGSGSGSAGFGIAKTPDLVVEVAADRKKHKFTAEAVQCGLWKFKVGGTEWSIHRHGGIMILTNGKDAAPAIHHGADPIHAVFPRHILGAADDIKVYEQS